MNVTIVRDLLPILRLMRICVTGSMLAAALVMIGSSYASQLVAFGMILYGVAIVFALRMFRHIADLEAKLHEEREEPGWLPTDE